MSSPARVVLQVLTLSLAITASVCVHARGHRGGEPPAQGARKALLIGVDGMQYEKLLQAIEAGDAPGIGALQLGRSYVGGVQGTHTQVRTNSGPGWTTVLTGTWANRHGVDDNTPALRSRARSVFQQIKQADPMRRTASIVSWATIHDNFADDIENGHIDLALKCQGVDQCVADAASQELEHGDPDFLFAQFNEPDATGHDHGFTPQYQQAIRAVDAQVAQVLAALQRRQRSHPTEQWLVMVAPDHGRRLPDGQYHGGQTVSEKTTFIALNQPANAQLTAPLLDPADDPMQQLQRHASQADITPTLLAHLGLTPPAAEHRMDGLPVIGPLGVRQLSYTFNPAAPAVTLQWRLPDAGRGRPVVRIFRNGLALAQRVGAQHYTDTALPAGDEALNYTVATDAVATSILVQRGAD